MKLARTDLRGRGKKKPKKTNHQNQQRISPVRVFISPYFQTEAFLRSKAEVKEAIRLFYRANNLVEVHPNC